MLSGVTPHSFSSNAPISPPVKLAVATVIAIAALSQLRTAEAAGAGSKEVFKTCFENCSKNAATAGILLWGGCGLVCLSVAAFIPT